MADIVNKVIKILFLILFCNQLITSTRPEFKKDDDLYDAWSDVLADDAAIPPADRSRRSFQNKRSARVLPEARVAGTAYMRKRKESLPTVDPGVAPTVEVPPPPRPAPLTIPVTNTPPPETSNVCIPNPCQNGGTCGKDKNGAYQCACPLNYRGKFCHEVMAKCQVIGCKDITDCISAPSGAVCVCKLGDIGRLCQMDIEDESDWEKVKMVISERTVYTGEIIVGVGMGVNVLLALLCAIHCHRVNSRRAVVRKRYKDILDKGVVPNEPPPDWCEISGDLFKDTLCCRKGLSLVEAYRPRSTSLVTSLSRTQSLTKQKEDELVRLLNSRTDVPAYGYDFPERIDQEISRRASSRRSLGMNNSHLDNMFDNSRDIPHSYSGTRTPASRINLRRSSFKPVAKPSADSLHLSRNNHAKLQKIYSSHDELIRRAPQQSRQHLPVNRQPSGSLTRLHKIARKPIYSGVNDRNSKDYCNKYDGNTDELESNYESQSNYKYGNNSARNTYNKDKSHIAKAKTVRYQIESDTENSRRRLNYDDDIVKKMGDISYNLENLKTSLSHRKSASNTNANSYIRTFPDSQTGHMRVGDVRYVVRNTVETYSTETSSEEESVVEEKLLIRINEENKTPDSVRGWYPNSSQNGNEYARFISNSTDNPRMYYDNLNYYQQHIKRPTSFVSNDAAGTLAENVNVNTNMQNELQRISVEDPMFYGHLIDPSMRHDNLETTHWYWDREPGVYCVNQDEENVRRFRSFKEERDTEIQTIKGDDICNKKSENSFNSMLCDLHRKTHDDLSSVRHFSGGPMDTRLSSQSGQNKASHTSAETGSPLIGIGSEYYGVWSKNIQLSPNEQTTIVGKKDNRLSVDRTVSFDQDMSTDRMYVRSFDDNGQKRYYVSDQLASRMVYEYQPRPDTNQEKPVIISENQSTEYQNMPYEQYECSTPTKGHSVIRNGGRRSGTVEDTPSTIVGTDNTTVISTGNLDGDTLVAETNASDTEVEL